MKQFSPQLKRTSFALLIATLATLIGHHAHAIRNGTALKPGQGTAIGFLTPHCTATLINENTIITAAHCFEQAGWSLENLKFTYTSLDGTTHTLEAIDQRIMSAYKPQELMLVRLKGKATGVKFPEFYSPTENPTGKPGSIAGWGLTAEGNPPSLLGANVNVDSVVNVSIENMDPRPVFRVKPTRSNALACPGDSGGPLFVDRRLVGVLSWTNVDPNLDGLVICRQATETYYVPAYAYQEWIKAALAELDKGTKKQGPSSRKKKPKPSSESASGTRWDESDWDPSEDVKDPLAGWNSGDDSKAPASGSNESTRTPEGDAPTGSVSPRKDLAFCGDYSIYEAGGTTYVDDGSGTGSALNSSGENSQYKFRFDRSTWSGSLQVKKTGQSVACIAPM